MAEICESQIPIQQLEPQGFCEACYTSFTSRTTAISVADGNARLIPTLRYRVRLCPVGFGLGRHLYSTTLVPGEEIEVEIFRSTKTVEELSKETSVEETFSQELSSTIQDEWSNKQNSNFKIGGGVTASLDLGIFSIGAHVEPEYSTQEETFQKSFAEFVRKSQAKTDRKFDVRMGVRLAGKGRRGVILNIMWRRFLIGKWRSQAEQHRDGWVRFPVHTVGIDVVAPGLPDSPMVTAIRSFDGHCDRRLHPTAAVCAR
jgi:hypothetical protein